MSVLAEFELTFGGDNFLDPAAQRAGLVLLGSLLAVVPPHPHEHAAHAQPEGAVVAGQHHDRAACTSTTSCRASCSCSLRVPARAPARQPLGRARRRRLRHRRGAHARRVRAVAAPRGRLLGRGGPPGPSTRWSSPRPSAGCCSWASCRSRPTPASSPSSLTILAAFAIAVVNVAKGKYVLGVVSMLVPVVGVVSAAAPREARVSVGPPALHAGQPQARALGEALRPLHPPLPALPGPDRGRPTGPL